MPMIKTDYKYSVYEDDTYDDAYYLYRYDWKTGKYDLNSEWDLQSLVEECAEDYHSNHDGWEHTSWNRGNESKEFWIWTDENTKVKFDVWLEFEPRFDARKSDA